MFSYPRETERYDSTLPPIPCPAWDAPINQRVASPLTTSDDNFGRVNSPLGSFRGGAGGRDSAMMYYPRPPMPMSEAQEQLKMYREELAKKERLIAQLTSIETPRPRTLDTSRIEDYYSNDKMADLATAKSEAAMLQIKVDALQSQLRDVQNQLDVREGKLRDLTVANETSKENETKLSALVQSLREKLMEYEGQCDRMEGTASRSEIAISTLQQENREAQARILELESRLRCHFEEQQIREEQRLNDDSRTRNFRTALTEIFSGIGHGDSTSQEDILIKVRQTVQELNDLKNKLNSAKQSIQDLEVEQKANRETITRLAAEAETEHLTASQHVRDLHNVLKEKESSLAKLKESNSEIERLKGLCDTNQKALESSQKELEEYKERFGRLDREAISFESEVSRMRQQWNGFKETLARILSDANSSVTTNDAELLDNVQMLVRHLRDKNARVELLEQKLSNTVAEKQSQLSDLDIREMDKRLRRAEEEVAAISIVRDRLQKDKEKFLQFLEQLSRSLGMDPITADMGLDDATDAALARANQLTKNESSTVVMQKTQVYSMQRKIKAMSEQLESKEVHLDLLRKKVTSLEERLSGKSELEREKDGEFVKNRKLMKLVENYKKELNEAHLEIRDLKARVLTTCELQKQSLVYEKELEKMQNRITELESIRQSQSSKISSLEGSMKQDHEVTEKKQESASNTIQALTSELRTTKRSLEETKKRETQLLDLRRVLSRMLGLDVDRLAIPDYEIVTRLEKLILANQANAATAFVLDSAIADVGDGFRAGYHEGMRALVPNPYFVSPHRFTRVPSPTRKGNTGDTPSN